jgi:hypothetical protein
MALDLNFDPPEEDDEVIHREEVRQEEAIHQEEAVNQEDLCVCSCVYTCMHNNLVPYIVLFSVS